MNILDGHYGHQVRILHWCTGQAITAALEEMDLTSSQGHIMAFLNHSDFPPCPKDIEDAFHLSHPTVSGLLSRLEKKGFVALCPDEKDRRCKRIHVLPKGMECHQRMHQTIRRIEEQVVEGFTEEEKLLFEQFLNRAISNMGCDPKLPKSKEDTTK